VNVSIGGTLTHFAAPPVLMVASQWQWDLEFMLHTFGWKAALAVLANSGLAILLSRSDLRQFADVPKEPKPTRDRKTVPVGVTLLHLAFLFLVVVTAHHIPVFLGIFLLFVGVMTITEPHQDPLQLRQSLLVGFFLAGLVVLGKPQSWWLSPMIRSLSETPLFFGSAALTAVTDNAALTFLGAQVPDLSASLKYALVAGAVTGGGLTVIANAPNPVGYGILKDRFGAAGIEPGRLLLAALPPTAIAAAAFYLL
jgi:Na+/H+ antiporter NhaD/arsenite permease-like protein